MTKISFKTLFLEVSKNLFREFVYKVINQRGRCKHLSVRSPSLKLSHQTLSSLIMTHSISHSTKLFTYIFSEILL